MDIKEMVVVSRVVGAILILTVTLGIALGVTQQLEAGTDADPPTVVAGGGAFANRR